MNKLVSACKRVQLFNVSFEADQVLAGAGYFKGELPIRIQFPDGLFIELPTSFQTIKTAAFEVNLVFDRAYGPAEE